MSVPAPIRQTVRARAQGRCEYCHSPEWVGAARFTMDHLVPRSRGGTDALENLFDLFVLARGQMHEGRANLVKLPVHRFRK